MTTLEVLISLVKLLLVGHAGKVNGKEMMNGVSQDSLISVLDSVLVPCWYSVCTPIIRVSSAYLDLICSLNQIFI